MRTFGQLPTLRDMMANGALAAVLAADPTMHPIRAAVRAYELADAMLAARSRGDAAPVRVEPVAAHGATDGQVGASEDEFSQVATDGERWDGQS